jgi:hypothetical protein
MSMVYDERTGWSCLLGRPNLRHHRWVEEEQRLEDSGVDWYRSTYGGLYARCSLNRFQQILSGNTESDPEEAVETAFETKGIDVTTLGANLAWPPLPRAAVQRLLRQAGLLARVKGKERPTEAATGLYVELEPEPPESSYDIDPDDPDEEMPRRTMVLWAFEVLDKLDALQRGESAKPRKSSPVRAKKRRADEHREGDPATWASDDEPMSRGQADSLAELCKEQGLPVPEGLTKAEAALQLKELHERAVKTAYEKVASRVSDVFGDTDRFEAWLRTPNAELMGNAPSMLMDTVAGLRIIEGILARISLSGRFDKVESCVQVSPITPPAGKIDRNDEAKA